MLAFLDYEVLRIIWWVLLGVLLIGFAIMDGFDLGVASLLPFVAKNDIEKRVVINTVGPVWEGNQVWLVLGGGAIFAAWPAIYAVSFSGFYLAMFVILAALILRPVGFKFRSKVEHKTWRNVWDACLFIAGFVPSLLFGVAVGNVMLGVPFHFDETLRMTYTGTFFELLNPFALLCGVISLSMFMRHGAVYLSLKTEGAIARRLAQTTGLLTIIQLTALLLAWWWVYHKIPGYVISSSVDTLGPSNPLSKTVTQTLGQYASNFKQHSWMLTAPALALGGLILSQLFFWSRHHGLSFICSAGSVFGTVSIVGLSMFPFILPSISHPHHSLTVWDASSSRLTLLIMLFAALVFVPIILAYTSWVYHVLRGKVSTSSIEKYSGEMY